MKKLLAVTLISLVSLNCIAGSHNRTISITNNTDSAVKVRDRDNHETSIKAGRSGSLGIVVHEPHGSLFPSSLMPHVTVITVTDDEGSNSIKIDYHTKSITVEDGLKLSKN
jgi:hypothetical protein